MADRLNISFAEPQDITSYGDTIVIPVFDDGTLGAAGEKAFADGDHGLHYIKEQMALRDFKGKRGQTQTLTAVGGASVGLKDFILLGVGKKSAFDEKAAVALAGPLSKALAASGARTVFINTDFTGDTKLATEKFAAELGNGLLLKSYSFDKYKTMSPDKRTVLQNVQFEVNNKAAAEQIFAPLKIATESELWAADLVNEPANVLNPETYEARLREEFKDLPVTSTVLDVAKMKELGMNLAVAVGSGSNVPPRMYILEYDGTNGQQEQPLALVGKGLTFDNGGISIKTADGMGDMKMDMGGSAMMVGAVRALALRNAKVHVVAILALAENSISSTAMRPGDVYKSMNGITVRVDNTDAEGRLVQADAMTYVQRTYNPHTMINASTLTGAIIVALDDLAGIFANDNDLARSLEEAGEEVNERGWHMPLGESFANAMKDKICADLSNMGGRYGGASKAADFMHFFVEKNDDDEDKCKWAHIDIAGAAMRDGRGNGFGVRLIDRLIANNYESKDVPTPLPKQITGLTP